MDKPLSINTLRAYENFWKSFSAWCADRHVSALPASVDTVACFVREQSSGHVPVTLSSKLTAISKKHTGAGFDDPCAAPAVRSLLSGARQEQKHKPYQKRAITPRLLRRMAERCPDTSIGKRDKAVLLLGFAGGFRRTELVNLDISDLSLSDDGTLEVRVHQTKMEPQERTITVSPARHLAICPVAAIFDWLRVAGISSGPLFRHVLKGNGRVLDQRITGEMVGRIVKARLPVGFDAGAFAGNSLRSGYVTDSFRRGRNIEEIMDTVGHKRNSTTVIYYRAA